MRWTEMLLCLPLSIGAVQANDAYRDLYNRYDYPRQLTLDAVPVCSQHGCENVQHVAFSDALWEQVVRHFEPRAVDAAQERDRVRLAIAEMEKITGALAGTAGDRAGDLAGLGTLEPQMDCIDESSNTTVYLTLFEQTGLLRWHRVRPVAHRGYLFFGGWPHFTAVIEETQTGLPWVVDSWFRDNGALPDVVELARWKDGWKPDGFVF